MLFEVWDDDENEKELIGATEIMLSELMAAPKQQLVGTLVKDGKHRGTLKIKGDSVSLSDDSITFHCTADVVTKKYLCCGFDNPYILFERARVNPGYELNVEDEEAKMMAMKEERKGKTIETENEAL